MTRRGPLGRARARLVRWPWVERIALAFLALVVVVAVTYPLIARHVTGYSLAETHACLRYLGPGAHGIPRAPRRFVLADAQAFGALDVDGIGVRAAQLREAVARHEFDRIDRDADGALQLAEARSVLRQRVGARRPVEPRFEQLDGDGDGSLTLAEAQPLVAIFSPAESAHYVRLTDANGDGRLQLGEYRGVPRARRFWLGTDALGRDLATRVAFGARVSLLVGALASLVSLIIGVGWGAVAGFVGGRLDAAMMRIVDIIYGLPYMFLVILLMVVFGRHFALLFVAIGAVSWLTMARIVRGQVLAIREQEYVLAARATGLSEARILVRHVLPNIVGPVLVYATLTVPAVMLQEAFLSFLGLGVQAPFTSWGALAHDGASASVIVHYPWLILFPGGALALTVLALSLVGDGLRDRA